MDAIRMHPTIQRLLSLPQHEQRSEEWYRARHTRLTASDAATALGQNPYETPDQLILKKCGIGPRFMGNEATLHGQRYEDEARDKFCAAHNLVCYEAGLLPHPTIGFLGGSPDGLVCDAEGNNAALLEIKCPLRRKITGEVPGHYMPQLQLLMEICDLPEAYFVEYKPEETFTPEEFCVVRVPRDREWFERSLPVFRAFWDRVTRLREHPEEALELARSIEESKQKRAPRKRKNIVDIDEGPAKTRCLIRVPASLDLVDEGRQQGGVGGEQ